VNTLYLEIAVVVLGILLLMVEAYSSSVNKARLAWIGAAGLFGVLIASFLPQHAPTAGSPAAAFVTSDLLSVFFVRLILAATIVFLLTVPSFFPVLSRSLPAERQGEGSVSLRSCPSSSAPG